MLTFCTVPANGSEINTEAAYLEQCIARIADGDKNALAELYNNTRISVYSFAFSVLKDSDDAEDILHDCFLHVWQSANAYKSMGKPMAWIITITRNLCLMKLREYSKNGDKPRENWEAYIHSDEHLSTEDKAIIRECMSNLSDEERQIVILHAVAGFKHREIAELYGRPVSTVLSKYNRAIKKMRNMIEGD